MKTTRIPEAVCLLLIIVIAVSCRNSRSTTSKKYPSNPPSEIPTKTYPVYADGGNLPPGQAKKIYGSQSAKAFAPGQRKKYANRYPLVIVHSPGIVISKYSDGRYYYKNKAGYIYWKGHDGRYYIDEKHLKGMEYDEKEYDDWKVKGQKGKGQNPKAKDNDKNGKDQTGLKKEGKPKGN